jgi:hypothetical protein
MCKERAEALMTTCASSEAPRYLVADAQRDSEDRAVHRSKLGCIPRIPATLKLVSQGSTPALQWGSWSRLDAMTRSPPLAVCHDGRAQRWLVVAAQAAIARAAQSVNTGQERACETLQTPLLPLHAKRLETPDAAHAALAALRTSWRAHHVATTALIAHQCSAGKGRPTPSSPVTSIAWPRQAQVRVDAAVLEADTQHRAC